MHTIFCKPDLICREPCTTPTIPMKESNQRPDPYKDSVQLIKSARFIMNVYLKIFFTTEVARKANPIPAVIHERFYHYALVTVLQRANSSRVLLDQTCLLHSLMMSSSSRSEAPPLSWEQPHSPGASRWPGHRHLAGWLCQ